MTARRLIRDIARQDELTQQLLALLDDEEFATECAHYGPSNEYPVLQRYRAIDEYRTQLKKRLLEGK